MCSGDVWRVPRTISPTIPRQSVSLRAISPLRHIPNFGVTQIACRSRAIRALARKSIPSPYFQDLPTRTGTAERYLRGSAKTDIRPMHDGLFRQTLLGLRCFLDRVLVLLAVCWPLLATFERDVLLSEIDAYEGHADRIAAAALELSCLVNQVGDDTVDLLNHRFRKNFRFGADLDRGDGSAGDEHPFFGKRDRSRD